jgi:hypothetical protein
VGEQALNLKSRIQKPKSKESPNDELRNPNERLITPGAELQRCPGSAFGFEDFGSRIFFGFWFLDFGFTLSIP